MIEVLFSNRRRDFSLRHCVQTASRVHKASCPLRTFVYAPELKWPESKTDLSSPSSTVVIGAMQMRWSGRGLRWEVILVSFYIFKINVFLLYEKSLYFFDLPHIWIKFISHCYAAMTRRYYAVLKTCDCREGKRLFRSKLQTLGNATAVDCVCCLFRLWLRISKTREVPEAAWLNRLNKLIERHPVIRKEK
jgi:hypothetical protein